MLVTYTSTVHVLEQLLVISHSAASTCLVLTPKLAVLTIYCCICKQRLHLKCINIKILKSNSYELGFISVLKNRGSGL
jgi:hypothetical protein